MSQPFQLIRKMLPYTTVAAFVALIYLAWVFYARYSTNREIARRAEEKTMAENRRVVEMYGSGQLKVMLFYASPPVVRRGETTRLCYSVANAKRVAIDHGMEEIKPSLSRCVEVRPVRTTTYTLSAEDEKGHSASQKVDVTVE